MRLDHEIRYLTPIFEHSGAVEYSRVDVYRGLNNPGATPTDRCVGDDACICRGLKFGANAKHAARRTNAGCPRDFARRGEPTARAFARATGYAPAARSAKRYAGGASAARRSTPAYAANAQERYKAYGSTEGRGASAGFGLQHKVFVGSSTIQCVSSGQSQISDIQRSAVAKSAWHRGGAGDAIWGRDHSCDDYRVFGVGVARSGGTNRHSLFRLRRAGSRIAKPDRTDCVLTIMGCKPVTLSFLNRVYMGVA